MLDPGDEEASDCVYCTFTECSDAYTWAYTNGLLIKGGHAVDGGTQLLVDWVGQGGGERRRETIRETYRVTQVFALVRVLPLIVYSLLWQCLPYF